MEYRDSEIHIGRMRATVTVRRESVGALLIGKKDNQVGFAWETGGGGQARSESQGGTPDDSVVQKGAAMHDGGEIG